MDKYLICNTFIYWKPILFAHFKVWPGPNVQSRLKKDLCNQRIIEMDMGFLATKMCQSSQDFCFFEKSSNKPKIKCKRKKIFIQNASKFKKTGFGSITSEQSSGRLKQGTD